MAYDRYLNSVNNYNNQELEIESLVNQDKTVFHQKVEESIAKFTDLALGLHGSAEMVRGLHGIYGKYKQKVLKKLKNATDDDLEDVGLNPEKLRPFQKWTEMKDMGGKQISPEDIARVRSGESFRSVMPDYDETSLSTRGLPAEADLDPYGMTGLAERVAKQKALYPEAFEPQFSGPVAPRGFGTTPEEPKPQLRSWDQSLPEEITKLQQAPTEYRAGLKPTYSQEDRLAMSRESAQMRLDAIRSSREKGLATQPREETFKYKPITEAEVRGKVDTDILPDIEDPLPRGGPTGAMIEDIPADIPHQAQGYRLSRAFMKSKKRLSKKLERKVRQQAQEQPEAEVERPLTPSQEITPVREDTPRVVQPDVPEVRPAPAVREGDVLPEEPTPTPRVAEGFSEMTEAPSTAGKIAGDVGTTVGEDVGEDLAFTALDAIPVIGQLGALGMGIYSMIEAFKPHHPPVEKIVPTGISFNPEGQMGGSGYV